MVLKVKPFILLLIIYRICLPFQTSSESINPFNKFISSTGCINAYSGDVAYSHQVCNLTGRNNMNIGVNLNYSSNVHLNIRARNDIAPSGWCGVGWNLSYGSIRCNHKGTRTHDDDDYIWISPNGISSVILKKGNKYFIKEDPYSKIEPLDVNADGIFDGWIITGNDGKKMKYGNLDLSGNRKATRWTFAYGNYVGAGTNGAPVHYPYQWDLSEIEDVAGNTIKFYYQQVNESLKVDSWVSPIVYTKESYPLQIINPEGKRIEFDIESKENETYDPYTFEIEPDGFMELIETNRLKKIKVFTNLTDTLPVSVYKLSYISINEVQLGTEYKKGLLSKIDTYNGNETQKLTSITFNYNTDFNKADNEHVSYDTDYNYGALESIQSGEDGKITFTYERKLINIGNFAEKDDTISTEVQKTYTGNLENGLPYVLFRGGLGHDRVWVYHWTGSKWELKLEYKDLIGDRGIKGIYPGVNNFALRGGITGDRLWVYEWDGREWKISKRDGGIDFSYQALGSTGTEKNVFPCSDEHMAIIGGGTGGPKEQDCIWMFDWNGYEWTTSEYELFNVDSGKIEIKDFWHENLGNRYEKLIKWISPNDLVVRSGLNRDRLYVFHYDGTIWRLAKRDGQNFWYDKLKESRGGERTIYQLGNDRFAVVGGYDGDRLWVFVWNGSEWSYAKYKDNNGNIIDMEDLTLDRATNNSKSYLPKRVINLNHTQFAVLAGGRNDRVNVFQWNGNFYELAKMKINGVLDTLFDHSFGRETWGKSNEYQPKEIIPNGYHFVVRAGKTSDRISVMSWDGAKWITSMTDSGITKDFYDEEFDENVRVALNGNNLSFVYGNDHDRVWAFRWNGLSWNTAKILRPADTVPIDFKYLDLESGSGKNPYLGNEMFVLNGGTSKKDRIWVFVWDGEKWIFRQWYEDYGNVFGKKVHNGGQYCVIRGGSDGNRTWFFYKFQDQVDQPVYTYVVKQKKLTGGSDNPEILFSYKYDRYGPPDSSNGNYDTNAGTAKFNKVETIIPSNGKIVQYYFNDTHADSQHLFNCDYYKLDGVVYRSATYNENNVISESNPLTETMNNYNLYSDTTWPADVYQKRLIDNVSKNYGNTIVKDVLMYDNTNGKPVIKRTVSTDGRQHFSKISYAYKDSAYTSGMGLSGANMLVQPSQIVEYEKNPGDTSVEPLPDEIRSAQAVTYSNISGCNAWLKHKTFVWKSDFTNDGKPDKVFTDYVHKQGVVNENWLCTEQISKYGTNGNPIEKINPLGMTSSVLFSIDNTLPEATVVNSSYDECFFTSFEEEIPWRFNNGGSMLYADNIRKNGYKAGKIKNPGSTGIYAEAQWKSLDSGLTMSKKYIFSGWIYSTGPNAEIYFFTSINGKYSETGHCTNVVSEPGEINKWVFLKKEFEAPAGARYFTIRIYNNGNSMTGEHIIYYDDLKYYPADAYMTVNYYDKKWRKPILSIGPDENPGNLTEYDDFGRPENIFKIDNTRGSNDTLYKKLNIQKIIHYISCP